MQAIKPSPSLYHPHAGELLSLSKYVHLSDEARIKKVGDELRGFFNNRYPCVAGLRAFRRGEYQIGLYGELGDGLAWRTLRNDLQYFVHEQERTQSTFLTFFAVFDPQKFTEDEFEASMWRELSFLTSIEDRNSDWGNKRTSDPASKSFSMSLFGTEFFVVGLHSASSRVARRFRYPTLVFNLFAQFNELQRLGLYDNLVKTIRNRDRSLQGSANPMAEEHGEKWEAIQFSGKNNSKEWKCPFHHMHQSEKP